MADLKPSDDDLRALLAAEKLATAGPWGAKMKGFGFIVTNDHEQVMSLPFGGDGEDFREAEANADFVALVRGLAAPMATELLALRAEVERLAAVLHEHEQHPDFEYETTTGPRKAFDEHSPYGDGWERNTARSDKGWERFEYHAEAYWRRRRDGGTDG